MNEIEYDTLETFCTLQFDGETIEMTKNQYFNFFNSLDAKNLLDLMNGRIDIDIVKEFINKSK